ncbi:hypothetical protein QEG26_002260 [Stenotrophomonas maltophilia]|nr:hypothetical protein [Stenotrophomonas maltophilia]
MAGLHCLGGGHDAVIVSTITPTAEQRLARYRAALAAYPDRFHALRVQFGEVHQLAMKAGRRIHYAGWQTRMPALWPPIGRA